MSKAMNEVATVQILIGDRVVMPEPGNGDAWQFGGFTSRVVAILPNGNLLVEDQDSDVWEVESERLTLVGDDQ